MTRKPIDALLINPGDAEQVYQSLGAELAAVEPPVWAGLMTSFLRQKGFSVEIMDAYAEGWNAAETARRAKEVSPLLVAVVVFGHQPSASTQIMPAAGALCAAIKQLAPAQKIMMVGGHVAALPERTLQEEAADFVCSGEGPYTILDLIDALRGGRAEDLRKVRGLWWRDGKNICANPPPPLVRDLDHEMPGLPWDLLPMKKYRAHNWHCFDHVARRQPYASFYTTLGCPYHCSFCCIQAPFKSGEKELGMKEEVNSYRFWSPKFIVDQIGLLVEKYGVRNIKIADEMFVLNAKHITGICDLIIERGYDLNIWAYARVDTVKDGMIEKLKRAGVNWLAFGIESGSDRVRDNVDKRFDEKEIFETVHKVQAGGIHVIGNYIFGLPEDDLPSMQDTLNLALELNCEFANFYCAMAYPGSPLYEQALREHWALPKTWSGYSQHSVDMFPLPTKYLPSAEVIRFRDRAFHTYFTDQKYIDMVRKKFGPDTERHIQQMLSHKLIRQHA